MAQIAVWDERAQEVREVQERDLERSLQQALRAVEKALGTMARVHNYSLQSFDVGFSLKAGIWVVTAQGSVTLHYEKPDSSGGVQAAM